MGLCAFPVFADSFVNGGFESGSFDSWTLGGGSYYGYYTPSGDPGKSAIVTAGTDPRTGGNLNMVYDGTYSARVNNYDYWYHYSTISQTVANYTDQFIYFAFAAVIEDPGHSNPGHVRITLTADNTAEMIYNWYIDYYSHPVDATWHTYGGWGYTDWIVAELDVSEYSGQDLTITVLASDCGAGGHGGYAYFDGFGGEAPTGSPTVPEPSTMILLGSGLLAAFAFARRKR